MLARRCGVPASRAIWVALAGPLIGAHLIAGPHNDAVMIALLVAGLTMGGRRPLAMGALLALAVLIKATALVVVPFALLLALGGRWRFVAAFLGTAGVVTGISGLGAGWLGALSHLRDLVQFTSPPTAVGMTVTYVTGFDAVPLSRMLGSVVLAGVLVLLFFSPGDPLRRAAWALAATVALAPSFHPWYALAPLVLLALSAARVNSIMLVPAAAALLVLPDGGGLARFAKFPGAPIMTVLLIVLAVRHLRPLRPAAPLPAPVEPRRPGAGRPDGRAEM